MYIYIYIYIARRLLKENGRRQAEKNSQTFSAGIYSVLSPLTCHVILHTHVLACALKKQLESACFSDLKQAT